MTYDAVVTLLTKQLGAPPAHMLNLMVAAEFPGRPNVERVLFVGLTLLDYDWYAIVRASDAPELVAELIHPSRLHRLRPAGRLKP